MNSQIEKAWTGFLQPLMQRPRPRQVAALCRREGKRGTEVLVITSRGSGRWIIPKGWPIAGMSDAQSALTEAWEEAGVRDAVVAPQPIGRYSYVKRPDGTDTQPPLTIETDVYPMTVGTLARRYPEVGQRRRRWVSPTRAARLVEEPGLRAILRNM